MIIRITPVSSGIGAPNAEQTLQPVRFDFLSGNSCVVTPSGRRQGTGMIAIAIAYEWKFEPTASDKREMEAKIELLMGGKKQTFVGASRSREEASQQAAEWLSQRKPN